MTIADRPALAATIHRLARDAGAAIMRIYATPFETRTKSDRSPVTDADEAAEAVILRGLAQATPGIPVVAEERVAAGEIPDVAGKAFWLVDPMDGTREFVSRNGEFTVNIALIEDGRPTLGVVYLPVPDIAYLAEGPGKARRFLHDDATGTLIAARQPPDDGLDVLASRSHPDPATEAWLRSVPVRQCVNAGSSLKFCRVAEGSADLYPRLAEIMEWDTAAGHAVVVAAGGSVRTLAGADLLYGKPGFRNPGFIVRGRDC